MVGDRALGLLSERGQPTSVDVLGPEASLRRPPDASVSEPLPPPPVPPTFVVFTSENILAGLAGTGALAPLFEVKAWTVWHVASCLVGRQGNCL